MSNFWGAYQFVRTYDFEEPSTLGAKTLGGRKVVSLC